MWPRGAFCPRAPQKVIQTEGKETNSFRDLGLVQPDAKLPFISGLYTPRPLILFFCPENQSGLYLLPSSEGSGCGPGPGSPGQEQVAAEDAEQGAGAPTVEVQGGQGAASLRDQHQVGPAEARLGTADGPELPQTHREGPGAPGGAGLRTWRGQVAGGAQTSPERPPRSSPDPSQPRPSRKGLRKTRGARGRHVPVLKSPWAPLNPSGLSPAPRVSPPTPSSLRIPHSSRSKRLRFPSTPHLWPCHGCPVCGERNHSHVPQSPSLATSLPGRLFHSLGVRYLLWCPQPPRVTPGWPELPCHPATIAPQPGRLQGQDLHGSAHSQSGSLG